MEALVQHPCHPLAGAEIGVLRGADDDGRDSGDGRKGGLQVGLEPPGSAVDVAAEPGVVTYLHEALRRRRVTDQELLVAGDQQQREGGPRPAGPELVTELAPEPQGLGDPCPIHRRKLAAQRG